MIWREHWCLYCCEKLTDCREATEGLAEMWILRVRAECLSWDFFHFHFHFLFMCFQRTCAGGGKKGQEAFGCYMFWHVLSSFWACGSYLPWHPRQLWILKDSGCGRKKLGGAVFLLAWKGFSWRHGGVVQTTFQALSIPQLAKPSCQITLPWPWRIPVQVLQLSAYYMPKYVRRSENIYSKIFQWYGKLKTENIPGIVRGGYQISLAKNIPKCSKN